MVVSPCYVLSLSGQDRQGRRTASDFGFSTTCCKGLTPRPFFVFGAQSSNPNRKVMKSGASRISKHISLLTVACQGEGRGVRAVTEQGTAVSPGPDHTQPGRRGFGKEIRSSRMSERFGRTSARYATRASLFLRKEASGSAGCASRPTVVRRLPEPRHFPSQGKQANAGKCGSGICGTVVPFLFSYLHTNPARFLFPVRRGRTVKKPVPPHFSILRDLFSGTGPSSPLSGAESLRFRSAAPSYPRVGRILAGDLSRNRCLSLSPF